MVYYTHMPNTPSWWNRELTGASIGRFVLVVLLLCVGIGGWLFWWPAYQQSQIRKIGTRTTATILSITPTGSFSNDQPEALVRLRVHAAGKEYDATTKLYVNPVYAPRYQPGAVVHVYYDPAHTERVVVQEENAISP